MPAVTTRGLRVLGRQLRERREELGYPTMRALRDATATTVRPSYVIMMAAENGTRANITGQTWERVAATYRVTEDSVTAVMAGRSARLVPAAVPSGEHARALAAAAESALGHLEDAASVLAMLTAPDHRSLARGARALTALQAADMRGLSGAAQVLLTIAGLDRGSLLDSARALRDLASAARAMQPGLEEEEAASPAPRAAG